MRAALLVLVLAIALPGCASDSTIRLPFGTIQHKATGGGCRLGGEAVDTRTTSKDRHP